MNKLLVICGPTSTGKTSLAIKIAKKFNGEIVSADSRQVYKGMDIGTGKDIPKGSAIEFTGSDDWGFYTVEGVKVWGYDLAEPQEEFNVARYIKFANKIIHKIQKEGRLPILTGGTGLYIKGVVDGIPTATIPKNAKLRQNLETWSAQELYENLSQLDSIKAASLNASDKNNPRRLIRAIEVAQWRLSNGWAGEEGKNDSSWSVIQIGLMGPMDLIIGKIEKRVRDRVDAGIKKEIITLIKNGVNWDNPSMLSIGYRQWKNYFEGSSESPKEDEVIEEWKKEEIKYAKRQMTWFKKDKRIIWFDIAGDGYPQNVENLIKTWYSNSESNA